MTKLFGKQKCERKLLILLVLVTNFVPQQIGQKEFKKVKIRVCLLQAYFNHFFGKENTIFKTF